MNDHREVRRNLLKILGSIPLTLSLGCSPEQADTADSGLQASATAGVQDLVAGVGHWPATQKNRIADFADRLLTAPGGREYFEQAASVVERIAAKLPGAMTDRDGIDLNAFTTVERELLLRFVRQFYSYLEVRNQVSGEPSFGECQTDPLFYTRLD